MVDEPRFFPSSSISPAAPHLSDAAVASQQEAPAAVGLRIPRPRRPSPRKCQRRSSRIPRSVRGSGCGVVYIRRDYGSSRRRAMQDRRGKWCSIPRPTSPGVANQAQGAQSLEVDASLAAQLRWQVLFARQLSRSWRNTTRHLASELTNHHNHQRAACLLHHAEEAQQSAVVELRERLAASEENQDLLMAAVTANFDQLCSAQEENKRLQAELEEAGEELLVDQQAYNEAWQQYNKYKQKLARSLKRRENERAFLAACSVPRNLLLYMDALFDGEVTDTGPGSLLYPNMSTTEKEVRTEIEVAISRHGDHLRVIVPESELKQWLLHCRACSSRHLFNECELLASKLSASSSSEATQLAECLWECSEKARPFIKSEPWNARWQR